MIEVFPPINPIISESQFHDAVREEKEDELNQDKFFSLNSSASFAISFAVVSFDKSPSFFII